MDSRREQIRRRMVRLICETKMATKNRYSYGQFWVRPGRFPRLHPHHNPVSNSVTRQTSIRHCSFCFLPRLFHIKKQHQIKREAHKRLEYLFCMLSESGFLWGHKFVHRAELIMLWCMQLQRKKYWSTLLFSILCQISHKVFNLSPSPHPR